MPTTLPSNLPCTCVPARKNLHSVWDSGIIEQERLSYTELAAFASMHTRKQKAEWENAPLDTWVNE